MCKRLFLIVLTVSLFFAAACSSGKKYPSVSSISSEWLEIKKTLYKIEKNKDYQSVIFQIDNFNISLNNFIVSPVGKVYRNYRVEMISEELFKALADIDSLLDRLKTAVQDSDDFIDARILSVLMEVDAVIELLQFNDANLSNIILMRIYLFLFFLTLIIFIFILVIQMMYSRFEKMKTREQQSILFSREIVNAQEHERRRIARELHDTVAQDLWRLSFQINDEQLVEEQRAIIQRIKNICDTLIPADFQRRGLLNALKKLALDFEKRTGIKCRITINNDIKLDLMDSDTQLQCFRIVQEGLTNTEKHAQADEVLLLIRQSAENNTLLICISDNGKGFIPPDFNSFNSLQKDRHMGLWNMYERASSISGTLTIISDSEGTMITLQVPLGRVI